MDDFVKNFDINNPHFKNVTNKKLTYLSKKILNSITLKFLIKFKIIGYLNQVRDNNISYSSFKEKKGLFPIRYVETHFFQSENFFKENSIDFRIKEIYLNQAQNVLSFIPSHCTKVFVHIRRGDYIHFEYLGEKGIDLPLSYYFNSMKLIENKIKDPFYIFISDDPAYVDCCFKKISHKYVSREDMQVDMAIMTLCECGVVSNSSFSWWGAYLMKNKKLVIFPKYWFGWKKKNESHIDIQPSWATLMEVDE